MAGASVRKAQLQGVMFENIERSRSGQRALIGGALVSSKWKRVDGIYFYGRFIELELHVHDQASNRSKYSRRTLLLPAKPRGFRRRVLTVDGRGQSSHGLPDK